MIRRLDSDDLARALFAASENAGAPVPGEQKAFVANEIGRLVGDSKIVGFAESYVDDGIGYIFAILGPRGFLLRWNIDDLEVTFLGQLRNLHYKELTHDLHPFRGLEGQLVLRINIEHERLPGRLSFEVADWMFSEFSDMRTTLREWAEAT